MEANINTEYIFSALVWCNTPNSARLLVKLDGSETIVYSSYHTGNGTWQLLAVRASIAGSVSSSKYVRLSKDTVAGVAFFDDVRYGRTTCNYTSTVYDRGSNKTQKGMLSFTSFLSGSPIGMMKAKVGISADNISYTWHPGLDFSEVTTTGRYVKYKIDFTSAFPNQVLYMKEPVAYKEADVVIAGGWTEVVADDKIYTTGETRKVGIGIDTPLANLHVKQAVASMTDGFVLSETAGWGYNPTFIASATNLGKDRLSLKCIDDQFSPLLSCRTSREGNGDLLTSIWPYSNTPDMPWLQFNTLAGMTTQNFIQIGDATFVAPPAAGAPLRQVASGSLGSRNYYVKITYKNATGETTPSAPSAGGAAYIVNSNNVLVVDIPPAPDNKITHVKVYVGTSSTNHTLQATVAITNNVWASWTEPATGLISGAAKPTTNTTGVTLFKVASGGSVTMQHSHINGFIQATSAGIYSGSLYLQTYPTSGKKIAFLTSAIERGYIDDYNCLMAVDIRLSGTSLKNFSGGASYEIDIVGSSKVTGYSYANYHDSLGNTMRIRGSRTPASASAIGIVGEICWDFGFIYVCIATNTWKRASIMSW